MSVQVRRRREAASFLSSYVGAQGELLVDTTNNRVQVHDGATPGGWPAARIADLAGRNAIINGNFAINQRAYASSVSLAAGAYAHDRWKAGSGGCTYTFTQAVPDTSVTITAGTLVQAIEASNVPASSYWLTWVGAAQARVWQGSASGSYAASPIFVTGLAPGTIVNVEFSTGTAGLVQLEAALPNAGPTRFERRLIGQEMLLCQRYYASYLFPSAGTLQFNAYYAASSYLGFYFALTVPMRAQPTAGYVGTWTSFNVTTFGIAPVGTQFVEPYMQVTATGSAGIANPANGGFFVSAEL